MESVRVLTEVKGKLWQEVRKNRSAKTQQETTTIYYYDIDRNEKKTEIAYLSDKCDGKTCLYLNSDCLLGRVDDAAGVKAKPAYKESIKTLMAMHPNITLSEFCHPVL